MLVDFVILTLVCLICFINSHITFIICSFDQKYFLQMYLPPENEIPLKSSVKVASQLRAVQKLLIHMDSLRK